CEHLALTLAKRVQRSRSPTQQARHDRRIEDALARRDTTQRVGEDGDIRDTLLQQVSRSRRLLLQQPQRVNRLDVLREDEHPDARMAFADSVRGDESLIRFSWWHLDVDDRDIGSPPLHEVQQCVAVARATDDFDAFVAQKACDSVADYGSV